MMLQKDIHFLDGLLDFLSFFCIFVSLWRHCFDGVVVIMASLASLNIVTKAGILNWLSLTCR